MDAKSIIDNALNLSPAEKLLVIETLSKSLNEPDVNIEKYWKEVVEQRYAEYLEGKIKSIPYEGITKK